ncbi:hemolysin D [Cloacibacterium rupense]|uniref:Hemolysin D n=2 Tax=Cloacibacterium rupense TaxID=517423 RepID=A0ABQ2NKI2_9FLAO|nr:hemolysin D [Cloacibacterium rupense]
MIKMNKKISIITLTVLLFSCGKEESTKDEFEVMAAENQITLNDFQIKNAGIETGTLGKEEISAKITLNGMVDVPPQNLASVSAPSGGYVKYTRFMPGMHVNKGETLAILEDPQIVQLQQDYLLAKSNLNYSQKDYARQSDLNKSKASSDKVMQKAQTEAQNQNILMRGMAEKLRVIGINPENLNAGNIRRSISVSSPVSGYISSVNVKIGQYVSPTDRLFEIVNTDDVHLALSVFEKDLNKIAVGQRVLAYTNQNPDKKYAANIILIGKDFQPDKSVVIHCHFIDYDKNLIPGTYMNAEVETNSEVGNTVPDDAIVTWENKQYIFQEVKPKTYKMVEVKIGNSENNRTEVFNLNPNLNDKKFVTKGAYHLLMGLKNVEE